MFRIAEQVPTVESTNTSNALENVAIMPERMDLIGLGVAQFILAHNFLVKKQIGE